MNPLCLSVFILANLPFLVSCNEEEKIPFSQESINEMPSPIALSVRKKNKASPDRTVDSLKPETAKADDWTTDQDFPGRSKRISVFAGAPYPRDRVVHLDTFGEFLWWTSGYDLSYAIVGLDTSTVDRTLLTFDSEYQPGCRVGLVYEFEKQGWDIVLDWTCFHNEKSKFLAPESEAIFLNWSSRYTDVAPVPAPQFDMQYSTWKLRFNQVGLEIGDRIYFGKYFAFRPSGGLRYLHIKDGFTIDYSSSVSSLTSNLSMKNYVHGFGFSFGFDNRFLFGAGISLQTNLKTGLIFSSTRVKNPGIINQEHLGFFGLIAKKNGNEMIPVLDGRIDLGWERSFYNNQFALSLTGGYEYHVLINGFNAIANADTGDADAYPYQKTNLFMCGLNLGAKISY